MEDGVNGLIGHHAVAPVDQGLPKEYDHVPTLVHLFLGIIVLMIQLNTPCVKQNHVQVCVKYVFYNLLCYHSAMVSSVCLVDLSVVIV